MAKRMGLSRESLYRILSGNPTLDNITKLVGALGVPISELFDKPDNISFRCPKCSTILEVNEKE
ncbi:DNA-binding protein [Petrimonas sp.]|uniref:helix-turn-helix domain-containing transcriptional regulator n=1 Tax=Petrimonas sp. TaxID=2023866 RepID=UPI003F518A34